MKTKQKNNSTPEPLTITSQSPTLLVGKIQDVEKLFSSDEEKSFDKIFEPIYCPFSEQTIRLKPTLTALNLRALIEATIEDGITPYDFYKTALEIIKDLHDVEQKEIDLNQLSFYDFCVILYYYKIQLVSDPQNVSIIQTNGESVLVNFEEFLQKFEKIPAEEKQPLEITVETSKGIPVHFTFHYPTTFDQIQYYKLVNARFISKIPEIKNSLKKDNSLLSLFSTTKTESIGSTIANKELLRTILSISLFLEIARVLKKIVIEHSKIDKKSQDVVVDVQNISLESRENLLEKLDAKTITVLTEKVSDYTKKMEKYFTTEEGVEILPHQKLFTN